MHNYLTYILCLSVIQEILDIRDFSYRFYLKVFSLKQVRKLFQWQNIVRIPSCFLIPNNTLLKLCYQFCIRSLMIINVDTLFLHLSPYGFHGFISCFTLNSTKRICFSVCCVLFINWTGKFFPLCGILG